MIYDFATLTIVNWILARTEIELSHCKVKQCFAGKMNVQSSSPEQIIESSQPIRWHTSCVPEAMRSSTPPMKVIETVIIRSALNDLSRCARDLGIFGFDLCEEKTSDRGFAPRGKPDMAGKLKVDFAIGDEETKSTLHALLETVHPESIGIFKFDQSVPGLFMRR